jgi:hypothetical protein
MKSVSTSTTEVSSSSFRRGLVDKCLFNQHDKSDCLKLKEWCTYHWYGTIKKSMESMNPAVYHDCCFSFSRRHFSKRSNHKPLESASVLRIPSFKALQTHDDFYEWVMGKIKMHERLGRKPIFPSINRHHTEDQCEETEEEEMAILAKRCQLLGDELCTAHGAIEKLTKDNKRLLESSLSWYSKYYESIERGDQTDFLYQTPQKPIFRQSLGSGE